MSNNVVFEDCYNLLCGDKLGSGIHRQVFSCRLRPELVVKVENAEWRYFANVYEQRIWDTAPKEVRKWLAPCEYLSPDGRILLQRRCDPVPIDYKLPKMLPKCFSDIKISNFGILNGSLVCLDYAILGYTTPMGLKKVDWQWT